MRTFRVLRGLMLVVALAATSLHPAPCLAQAEFVEGFDENGPVESGQFGPSGLIAR